MVKKIYGAALKGKSYGVIAEELTSDNIPSPGGKDYWHPGTVKKILTNVTYNGDYLFQKTFIKDTLEETVVTNNGELPMYLIENHHVAIIDKNMWDKVQTILRKRSKQYSQRFTKKKIKKNSKNRAFEKKFYCGECGNLIGHYRYVSNNNESNNWKCNHSRRYYLKDKCTAPGFQQEYIELNFMKLLQSIKDNQGFIQVHQMIIKKDLDDKDIESEQELRNKMEQLNQELYQLVDEELNKQEEDCIKVDELTDGIIALQNQLNEFTIRKELAEHYQEELSWFENELSELKNDDLSFRRDIFERMIVNGTIDKNSKITYKFIFGLEWSIDYCYDDYKNFKKEKKKENRKRKLLNSKEVKALLKYCKEPRKFNEMFDFMNTMKFISESHLRTSIIYPLLKSGKLNKTCHINKNQMYYSSK